MPRPFLTALASLGLLAVSAPAAAQGAGPDEAGLRAADAEQMRIIVAGDAATQERFMHPDYMLNGPANRVRRKPELVAALGRGEMASERFERAIEGVQITGAVGIVMERETVRPAPGNNLAWLHPGRTLQRRFTSVFLWQDGR